MTEMDLTQTAAYSSESVRQEHIQRILAEVASALEERGYNAVNQLAGYLITNDPAYISSHRGARRSIQEIERYAIIEELVRVYLNK